LTLGNGRVPTPWPPNFRAINNPDSAALRWGSAQGEGLGQEKSRLEALDSTELALGPGGLGHEVTARGDTSPSRGPTVHGQYGSSQPVPACVRLGNWPLWCDPTDMTDRGLRRSRQPLAKWTGTSHHAPLHWPVVGSWAGWFSDQLWVRGGGFCTVQLVQSAGVDRPWGRGAQWEETAAGRQSP